MNLAVVLSLCLAQVQVDQKSIDEAIAKGLAYLKTAESPGHYQIRHCDELILYTFVVAGVPKTDDRFQKLLQRVLTDEPTHTYRVSLQAMLLEELDRAKVPGTDRPLRPVPRRQPVPERPVVLWRADEAGQGRQRRLGGPQVGAARDCGGSGEAAAAAPDHDPCPADGTGRRDNSNSQYAALGLRACADSGILLPESTLTRGERWWRTTILIDKKVEKNAVASGGEGPQGWGYKKGDDPYNSMTAGGAGCLVIYDYLLKRDWKKNAKTKSAIAWLSNNYWMSGPPQGLTPYWYPYYLYAIERVGMLYDTALLGAKDWYLDGARWLLQQQGPNGAWDGNKLYPNPSNPTFDTCFAILFLKKATRGLTVSKDR